MKYFAFLIGALALAFGSWYTWEQYSDELIDLVQDSQKKGSIITFELATSPDLMAQKLQKELLKSPEHSFGQTVVKFVPYLLMDIKYPREDKKTEEAKVLWSLENGEMVLDTATFETTHGFEDCINSQASEDDFRILHALSRKCGVLTKEGIADELGMDPDVLQDRLEVLRKKHLISLRQENIRLHFQSPLLRVQPQTKFAQSFVTKEVAPGMQIKAKYSKDACRKVAKAAFGHDFAIRYEEIVFVPIFLIEVKNPDGSILKTYWNGLTGKKYDLRGLL